MAEDLRTALGRAGADPGADDGGRPDLGPLWQRGRGRRRRVRVVSGAAVVVVVAVLAAGGVALLGGDDRDEGVMAGPGAVELPVRPPPEPTDGPVTATLASGPVVDGLPTVDEEVGLDVAYSVQSEYLSRGRFATWELWDGERWTATLGLVSATPALPQEEPRSGAVVPLPPPPTEPEENFVLGGPGASTDHFPAPLDLEPGYYRVCREFTGSGVEVVATPCAQVWVPPAEGVAPTTVAASVTLRVAPEPVEPGAVIEVVIEGADDGEVQRNAGWEQSEDGEEWVRTHAVGLGASADDVRPAAGAGRPPTPGSLALGPSTTVWAEVPPADEMGPSHQRLCIVVGPAGTEPTCIEVAVAAGPDGDGGTIVLRNLTGPVEVGGELELEVRGAGEGWSRSGVGWEAREGTAWTLTHRLGGVGGGVENELAVWNLARPADPDDPLQADVDQRANGPIGPVLLPDTIEPGHRYRACVALGLQVEPNQPFVEERTACVEVPVVAPDEPIEPAPTQPGDPVTWVVDALRPPEVGSWRVRVIATRPGCPGAGHLRPEDVEVQGVERRDGATVITLVLAAEAPRSCPPDDGSLWSIWLDLPEPLRAEPLVDAACDLGTDLVAPACRDGAERWRP